MILHIFALHTSSLVPLAASSLITFLQPTYSHSRFDKLAKIPVLREIIDNGKSQVTYRTRDLTAKDGRVRVLLLAWAGREGWECRAGKRTTLGWQKRGCQDVGGTEGTQGLLSAQG